MESTPPPAAPYPTVYVAQHQPTITRGVVQLRPHVAASPTASAPSSDPCNHTALLDLVDSLIEAAQPAFGLFFTHPTRRLSQVLIHFAEEATTAIAWLAQTPVPEADPPLLAEYPACCERMQTAIRDWRLAIRLELVSRELDEQPLETLH